MPDPTETELKLALSEEALARLRESETLAAAGALRRERIVTTYWDTPDRALARRGLSLRVRVEGERRTQTVKLAGSAGLAMQRGEWEWPVEGDTPDFKLVEETPVREFAGAEMAPVLTTDVLRESRRLDLEGAEIEVDLDEGEIRAGAARAPIRELELELRKGAPGALYRLALALHAEAPFAIETESKAERGMRLLDGGAPKPRKAEPRRLIPGLSGAETFRRIIAEALGHLLANVAAAKAGDAEGVHQLRVGIRRLRSALRLFAPDLAPEAATAFEGELRALGLRVGEARDWSVFCDERLPLVFAQQQTPDWGRMIAQAAHRRRDEAFAKAAEATAAPTFAGLVLSLAAWAEEAERRPRLIGGVRLDRPIERLAPDLIETLARQAAKRGRRARSGEPEALHGFRKALKKLRYGLDFLEGVYAAPDKTQRRIKKLLKTLGRLNDAHTAAELALKLGAERIEIAPAVAAFVRQRERELRDGLPRVARLEPNALKKLGG